MRLFEEPAPRTTRVDADWELHRRHRQAHAGPPQDEVGIVAMSAFDMARSSDVAVSVRDITAFSDGLLLSVVVLFADEQNRDDLAWALQEYSRSPGRFRLGVELPNGIRATTGNSDAPPLERPESGAVLTMQSSSAGTLRWQGEYWLWPLPTSGTMTIGCSWPDRGIAEALVSVEAAELLSAAANSRPIWERP